MDIQHLIERWFILGTIVLCVVLALVFAFHSDRRINQSTDKGNKTGCRYAGSLFSVQVEFSIRDGSTRKCPGSITEARSVMLSCMIWIR